MARILIPILLITISWSGYWFWGANDNLENIYTSLENPKSGSINIKYGSTNQVGFPNRYDVTVNNLSIENSNGKQIADIIEFKKMLLDRKELVTRCLTTKMLTYATGRKLEATDRGEVDKILEELNQYDNRLRDLVNLVVQSSIFLNK